MNKHIKTLSFFLIFLITYSSFLKAKPLSKEQLLVKSFYDAVSVNPKSPVDRSLNKILSSNFTSMDSRGIKDRDDLIHRMKSLWKIIPDLKFEVVEILQDDNKVIVRYIFSGTPKGYFNGLTFDGMKSFKVMSVDIHTIEKGKIINTNYITDWSSVVNNILYN